MADYTSKDLVDTALDEVQDWRSFAKKHGYRIGQMGFALGVSRYWLGIYLRRRFRSAPHLLLVRWRAEEIKKLSGLGTINKQIAEEVGFANSANLIRSLGNTFHRIQTKSKRVDKMTIRKAFGSL